MSTLRAEIETTNESTAPAEAAGHTRLRPGDASLELVLTGVVTALIVGASLTPFRWNGGELAAGVRPGALGWPAWKWPDALANLLAYVPLGAAWALLLRRRLARWAALAGAALIGSLLSFFLETLQAGLAARWPSWPDFLLNSLGGLIGAVLAVQTAPSINHVLLGAAQRWARWRMAIPRWTWWTALAAIGLFATEGALVALTAVAQGRARWSLQYIPFWDYFHHPEWYVLRIVLTQCCFFAAAGAVSAALAGAMTGTRRRGLAAVVGALTILGAISPSAHLSVTDSLIAIAGAAIGWSAAQRWRALLKTVRVGKPTEVPPPAEREVLTARRRAFADAAPLRMAPRPDWLGRPVAPRADSR